MQAYHQYGVGSRRLCKLQKIGALDSQPQVFQLFAHDRWFSPGTPVSSTTKTGRHDIAEILLKAALNIKNQIKLIKSIQLSLYMNVLLHREVGRKRV